MVCPNPKCKATVPAGLEKCKRCGFPLAKSRLTPLEEVTSRPWLMALLASSAFMTLWIATRRAPPPPAVPAAEEPVATAPAPEPEPVADDTPLPVPAFAPAPAAPVAETAPAAKKQVMDEPLVQTRDGKWSGGPVLNPKLP